MAFPVQKLKGKIYVTFENETDENKKDNKKDTVYLHGAAKLSRFKFITFKKLFG